MTWPAPRTGPAHPALPHSPGALQAPWRKHSRTRACCARVPLCRQLGRRTPCSAPPACSPPRRECPSTSPPLARSPQPLPTRFRLPPTTSPFQAKLRAARMAPHAGLEERMALYRQEIEEQASAEVARQVGAGAACC